MKRLPIIGVIGSHVDSHPEFSIPLGEMIAARGYHLLTGGGGGVMTSVAKSFTSNPSRLGLCIGIVPIEDVAEVKKLPHYTNPYIEVPIITHLTSRAVNGTAMPMAHNEVNILSSDVIIGLPGLKGTKAETSMALVLEKPVILFGRREEFSNFPTATMVVEEIKEVERFIARHLAGR